MADEVLLRMAGAGKCGEEDCFRIVVLGRYCMSIKQASYLCRTWLTCLPDASDHTQALLADVGADTVEAIIRQSATRMHEMTEQYVISFIVLVYRFR